MLCAPVLCNPFPQKPDECGEEGENAAHDRGFVIENDAVDEPEDLSEEAEQAHGACALAVKADHRDETANGGKHGRPRKGTELDPFKGGGQEGQREEDEEPHAV